MSPPAWRLEWEGHHPARHRARDGPEHDFNEPLLERALCSPPFDEGDVVLAMAFLLPGRHAGEGGDVAQIVQSVSNANPVCGSRLRVHRTGLLAEHPLVLGVLADRVRGLEVSVSPQSS